MKLHKTDEKGFTLIELMIVIAIIGILAAIAIPNFISYRNRAYCTAMQTDASAVAAAIADYFAVPTNRTVSTASLQATVPQANLSYGNTYVVNANGNGWDVVVTDGTGRCQLTTGGANTYTKTVL